MKLHLQPYTMKDRHELEPLTVFLLLASSIGCGWTLENERQALVSKLLAPWYGRDLILAGAC